MQNTTIEDYCRLIVKLDQGKGVKVIELSNELQLSKNTVSFTLQKLRNEDYIHMEKYGKVTITKKGLKVAQAMNFKHRVLETFLFEKLKMNKKKIHEEACALEHWTSDDLIHRLYVFLGKPKLDPHGRVIV